MGGEWVQVWGPPLAVLWAMLLSGFVAWITWSFKQKFATREALEKGLADERQARRELARRVDRQELVMESMPTKEELHHLQLNIVELSGRLDSASVQLQAVANIAKRLEDFELQKGRK